MEATDSRLLMPPRFREVQPLRENPASWVGIIAVGLGIVGFLYAASYAPVPDLGAAAFTLILFAAGALLLIGELRTEVRDDGLYVQFFLLTRRHRIPWSGIERSYARRYKPLRDFGGWGVRWGAAGKAYNVRGDQGLQLELVGGKRLLIGSQRAEELALAVDSARAGQTR